MRDNEGANGPLILRTTVFRLALSRSVLPAWCELIEDLMLIFLMILKKTLNEKVHSLLRELRLVEEDCERVVTYEWDMFSLIVLPQRWYCRLSVGI